MADIFISYSKKHEGLTKELARDLEAAGYTTWWDTNLLPDDAFFPEKIRAEIESAKAVIVIWAEHSVTSRWVYSEANEGHEHSKLLQVRDEALDPRKVPLPFKSDNITLVKERAKIFAALVRKGIVASNKKPEPTKAAALPPEEPLPPPKKKEPGLDLFSRLTGARAEPTKRATLPPEEPPPPPKKQEPGLGLFSRWTGSQAEPTLTPRAPKTQAPAAATASAAPTLPANSPGAPSVRVKVDAPISMPKSSGGKHAGHEMEASASVLAEALDRRGKLYREVAEVRACPALHNTTVTTVLANGTKETSNVAEPGDYIVTGAGGERWVVKPGTFEARYVLKPGRKTVYAARGEAVAVKNPFGRPISIMAPWGEKQYGAVDCMIADVFDPAKRKRAGEPYIIARTEFDRTYKLVQRRESKSPTPKRKLTRG